MATYISEKALNPSSTVKNGTRSIDIDANYFYPTFGGGATGIFGSGAQSYIWIAGGTGPAIGDAFSTKAYIPPGRYYVQVHYQRHPDGAKLTCTLGTQTIFSSLDTGGVALGICTNLLFTNTVDASQLLKITVVGAGTGGGASKLYMFFSHISFIPE